MDFCSAATDIACAIAPTLREMFAGAVLASCVPMCAATEQRVMANVKISALVEFANANAEMLENSIGVFPCDDVFEADDLLQFIHSCTPSIGEFLHEHGLFVDGDTIYYAPEQYDVIGELTARVVNEYDSADRRMPTWRKYELSGDDDVDYNGGYIDTFIDLLNAYDASVERARQIVALATKHVE